MAYMANIKTLSVFSVNDFLDRKILDYCLSALVLLLNGKNSWQTHCMEFCRGQIRERNVIRLGRTGIGRDRAYFSSFVLRSVTVSSRISLSFNLVSRLILHRLQGPGGRTTGLKHLLKTSSMSIFAFTPREQIFCNPNRRHRCHWLQLAITLFPVDWFPSSAIHCNRSTSVPIYCHLSFYIVTIAFTFNKLPYNQYNYYVIGTCWYTDISTIISEDLLIPSPQSSPNL